MTNSEARKRITGASDWHTCDRAEQAEATIARIRSALATWHGVTQRCAQLGAARECSTCVTRNQVLNDFRAALEDQP